MRKFIIPASAAAFLGLSVAASFAAPQTGTSGKLDNVVVQKVNKSALTITLANGNTYKANMKSQLNKVEPGEHVMLQWTEANGSRTITKIAPVM